NTPLALLAALGDNARRTGGPPVEPADRRAACPTAKVVTMVQTCPRCCRTNPVEALFCYHDGNPLGNGRSGDGPRALVEPARRRFPMPFVFPSGRACHSFDELALGCFDDWPAALELV